MRELRRVFLAVGACLAASCGLVPPDPGDLDGASPSGRVMVDQFALQFHDLGCGNFTDGAQAAALAGDFAAATALAQMQARHPCILMFADSLGLDMVRFILTGGIGAGPFPPPGFYQTLCPVDAPPRRLPELIDLYLEFGLEAARMAVPRTGPCRDALRADFEADGGLTALYRLSQLAPIDPLEARFARAGATCAADHSDCMDAASSARLHASIAMSDGAYSAVRLMIDHAALITREDARTFELEQALRIQAAVGLAYGHPPPDNQPRADAFDMTDWFATEAVQAGRAPPVVLEAAEACRGQDELTFFIGPIGLDDPAVLACWSALAVLDPHRVMDREARLSIELHQARMDGLITGPDDLPPYLEGVDRDAFAAVLYTFDFSAFDRDAFNCPTPAQAYRNVWESLADGPDSAACARLARSGVAPDDFAGQAALFPWTGCPVDEFLDAPWHAARLLKIRTRAGEARAFQCAYAAAQAAQARSQRRLTGSTTMLLAGVRLGVLDGDALDLARRDMFFDLAEEDVAAQYGHLPSWPATANEEESAQAQR